MFGKPPGQPTLSKVLFFFKQQSPSKIKIYHQACRPNELCDFSSCFYIISFLNCRTCCYGTNDIGTIFQVDKGYCQGQQKQQKACEFIHSGMFKGQSLIPQKSQCQIYDFYKRNDENAAPEPDWDIQRRQQLCECGHYKYKISNGIQSGTEGRDGFRFPCNGSIDHISKTTEQIQEIKLM